MVLLMVGVFWRGDAAATVLVLSVATVAVAMAILWVLTPDPGIAYGGLFVNDAFTAIFMKSLVLVGSLLTIVMSIGYAQRRSHEPLRVPDPDGASRLWAC